MQKDLSVLVWTESGRFLRFALMWFFVGLVGMLAFAMFRERLSHPEAVRVVVLFAWAAVFVYESWLNARAQTRVQCDEAERAAKERGEVSAEMATSIPSGSGPR